jgi:hypothetical protein
MTLMSAVNQKSVNPCPNLCQREGQPQPMTPASPETLESGEATLRSSGRGRRAIVIVMGMILAGVTLTIVGLAFIEGSWWYSYTTDQALNRESRARIEAIRDEVDASGAMPEVVTWLSAALDPNADPTTVRNYLVTAQETMGATGDPRLAEAVRELRGIIQTIRSAPLWETTTPRPVPTLGWPY